MLNKLGLNTIFRSNVRNRIRQYVAPMKAFHIGIVSAFLLVGTQAYAGFIAPSYAGQPHSTTSTWDYAGDWSTGNSASHMTSSTTTGGTYPLTTQDNGCGPGVPCLLNNDPEHLTFYIPNFVDPLPDKFLRVQFKFVHSNQADPFVEDVIGFDPTGFVNGTLVASSYQTDTVMENGVFYTYGLFDYNFKPNPDYERFTISGVTGSELKQVRVDTISNMPEPTTLLLISAAMVGIGASRRRH